MKRKCVVILAILVLMQVLCGVQSAPKAQTAGEKKPTILVESKNFFKNNPITEIYEYLYGECPVEFVALPSNGAEREAKIEEIRAEIEAGGTFTRGEDLMPGRESFGTVWRVLRRCSL